MLSDKRPIVITMLATHKGAQISLLRLDGTFWWYLNRQRQESSSFWKFWFQQERRDHPYIGKGDDPSQKAFLALLGDSDVS